MEHLESSDSSVYYLSELLKNLINDAENSRKRRDVGAGNSSTTNDIDSVLFVLPLIKNPANPSVNFFAENADGGRRVNN